MISGDISDFNILDLKKYTVYHGEFHENHQLIKWFWEVLGNFKLEEKRALLQFVTSCSRPPLLGFAELNPLFGIQPAGKETDRLPSASTCFNLLKLPLFQSKEQLKEKLLYAVNSRSGFDLS